MTTTKRENSRHFLIYVVTAISSLGQGVTLPVLPLFLLGLGISFSYLGVISVVPSVMRLLMQTPFGKLSDRVGRRVLITIGFFLTAGVAPLYLMFNSLPPILLLRGIEGVAAALCAGTLTIALLSSITNPEVQGKVMGYYQGCGFVGLAVGPLIGGYVADVFGIPLDFYVWGVSLGMSGVLFLFLREPQRGEGSKMEAPESADHGKNPSLVASGFMLGFLGVTIISMMNLLGGTFLLTYLPPWAEEFGISDFYTGLIIFSILGTMAVCAFLLGSLSDKYGRRKVIVGGSFVISVGFFLYSVQQSYVQMLVSAVLTGVGSAIIAPALNAYIREIMHSARLGEGFGIVTSIATAGNIVGLVVFGFIADRYGLRTTTFIFAGVTLAMTFTSFLIKEWKTARSGSEGG